MTSPSEAAWIHRLWLLAGLAAVLAAIAWWRGPWTLRMVPLYWPIVATGLIGWFALRRRHDRARRT